MNQQAATTRHESRLAKKLSQPHYDIIHHIAITGVTGSCHKLKYRIPWLVEKEVEGILINCGLF